MRADRQLSVLRDERRRTDRQRLAQEMHLVLGEAGDEPLDILVRPKHGAADGCGRDGPQDGVSKVVQVAEPRRRVRRHQLRLDRLAEEVQSVRNRRAAAEGR